MTGSTMEPNEPEHNLDPAKNQEVRDIIARVMETQPPNIGWMESELAHMLLAAASSARTMMMMSFLRSGVPKEDAEKQADMQWPLLMFDLGLRTGYEHANVKQMRDMFGDDMPEWPT